MGADPGNIEIRIDAETALAHDIQQQRDITGYNKDQNQHVPVILIRQGFRQFLKQRECEQKAKVRIKIPVRGHPCTSEEDRKKPGDVQDFVPLNDLLYICEYRENQKVYQNPSDSPHEFIPRLLVLFQEQSAGYHEKHRDAHFAHHGEAQVKPVDNAASFVQLKQRISIVSCMIEDDKESGNDAQYFYVKQSLV